MTTTTWRTLEIMLSTMAKKDGKCGNYKAGDHGLATADDMARHDWFPCLYYNVELREVNHATGEIDVLHNEDFDEHEDAFIMADRLRERFPGASYEEVPG